MSENRADVPLSALRKSPTNHGYSPLSSDAGTSEEELEAKGETQNSDAERNQEDKSSSHYTLMVIIRCFVGTGILAMPYAFKNLGLVLGFVGLIVCWLIMTYSLYILVDAAASVEKKCKKRDLGYGEVMEEVTLLGPKCLRNCAKASRSVLNGLIVFMQFGCCCVYIVFIADNLKEVFNEEFDLTWSNKKYICILAPLFLMLACVRHINLLAKLSIFGNLVFAAGFVIILQYVAHDFIPLNKLPWVVDSRNWAKGLCTAAFAFEGICMILPLRSKMRRQEDYMGCNGVLMTSMYLVLILYECLGFYGFLRFGTSVHATISLDLPHEPLYITLKILFPLVIFVSFAVQFSVVVDILYLHPENGLVKKIEHRGRSPLIWEYVFRLVFSLLTIIFALVIPMLGSLMELCGALLGITLSITFPHIIVLLDRYSDGTLGCLKWRIPFHILFVILGVFVACVGTFTTIQDVVQAYHNPDEMEYHQLAAPSQTAN